MEWSKNNITYSEHVQNEGPYCGIYYGVKIKINEFSETERTHSYNKVTLGEYKKSDIKLSKEEVEELFEDFIKIEGKYKKHDK